VVSSQHRRILRDPEVIARTVAFVSGEARSSTEQDALQRELWDRSARWAGAA
jgi:hypothetical protein